MNTVHLTEDDLAALVYAARRDPDLEHRAYTHLAVCAACTGRLGELRAADRNAARLLTILDVPTPTQTAGMIAKLAQAPRRRFAAGWARAAAIVAFVVAAAAAAAYPASPLYKLLVRTFTDAHSSQLPARKTTATAGSAAAPGVSFVATGESLDVDFEGQHAGGVLELHVIDGNQVSFSSPSPGSTYRVSRNRIVVFQKIPGRFRLDVPRSLPQTRVRVGTDVVFERGVGKNASADAFTIKLTRLK